MGWLKTVIHIHTDYSYDSNRTSEELIETAERQGVDCIAVTDHDEIAGALEVRRRAHRLRVIVGEEISSADGHIIGLFLQKRVPPGLSAEETAGQIRAQGGLVFAPHPFATLCENSVSLPVMRRLLPWLDAVEICNAQNLFFWEERAARRFAREHGLISYVGADAHIRGYLDACYQMLPPFDGPQAFLAALRHARLHPGRFGPAYYAVMGGRHLWDKVFRRGLPGFGVNTPAEFDPRLGFARGT
jgi:predicted metal-dependent phosphoesterase TrpH